MIKLIVFYIGIVIMLSSGNLRASNDTAGPLVLAQASTASAAAQHKLHGHAKQKTIVAKFVSFTLGDAAHYEFIDKSGKTWDFGGNNAKDSFEFGKQLPEKLSNSDNQGWESNKKLVGKWFKITYEVKKQPLYQDGPVGDVNVIVAVSAEK